MHFNRKYLLKSSLKVANLSRLIAKCLDLFIVFVLCYLFYPVGAVLSIFYLCVADCLLQGQSVGKKLIGFAVISLEDGMPCSFKQSAIRNLPLTVPLFFLLIPFWGWIFALALGIPLAFLEVYLIFKLDSGHRLGDVMADTTVIANDIHRADLRKMKESWFTPKAKEALDSV